MYRDDSFFDLSVWGQVGLAAISAVLFLIAVAVAWAILRKRHIVVRFSGAVVLFWMFVWLSPQVYYIYYRMIIPDLPLQWVIWPPPAGLRAVEILLFQYQANLSAHGQALLGWSMIIAAVIGNAPLGRLFQRSR